MFVRQKEEKIEEARRLVCLNVINSGNMWFITNDYGNDITVKADDIGFAGFLQKIKACDNATYPKSKKNITYMNMVLGIKDLSDNQVWIWSNSYFFDFPQYIII